MSFKCPPNSRALNCKTNDETILHRTCIRNNAGCPKKKKEVPTGVQRWQRYSDSSEKCLFYKNNALNKPTPIWEPLSGNSEAFVTTQIIKKNERIEKCGSSPKVVLEGPPAESEEAPVYTASTPEPYDPYPPAILPEEPEEPILEHHTEWYERKDNEGTWYENMHTHETVLELPKFGRVIEPPTGGKWETKKNGNSPYCLHESGYTLLGPCANEKTAGNTPGNTPGNTSENTEAKKLGLSDFEYAIYLKYINKQRLTYSENVVLPHILRKVASKKLSNTHNNRVQELLKKYQKGVPSEGGRRTKHKKLKRKKGKSRKYHRK